MSNRPPFSVAWLVEKKYREEMARLLACWIEAPWGSLTETWCRREGGGRLRSVEEERTLGMCKHKNNRLQSRAVKPFGRSQRLKADGGGRREGKSRWTDGVNARIRTLLTPRWNSRVFRQRIRASKGEPVTEPRICLPQNGEPAKLETAPEAPRAGERTTGRQKSTKNGPRGHQTSSRQRADADSGQTADCQRATSRAGQSGRINQQESHFKISHILWVGGFALPSKLARARPFLPLCTSLNPSAQRPALQPPQRNCLECMHNGNGNSTLKSGRRILREFRVSVHASRSVSFKCGHYPASRTLDCTYSGQGPEGPLPSSASIECTAWQYPGPG